MQNGSLTYGQLAQKLEALGYKQKRDTYAKKPARIFNHNAINTARILLPDAADDDIVEEPFLNMTSVILKTHGLIEEKNPLLC